MHPFFGRNFTRTTSIEAADCRGLGSFGGPRAEVGFRLWIAGKHWCRFESTDAKLLSWSGEKRNPYNLVEPGKRRE